MNGISVLMPVYNASRFLEAAVQSVLGQTHENFELLAMDDGSTDGSRAILEAFASRDPRVRVLARENRGIVDTLNELVAAARHPLLARMDADDICHPERFAVQMAYLDRRPEVAVVGADYLLIDELDRRVGIVRQPSDHAAVEAALLQGHCSLCHPSALMRAEVIRSVGGYRPAFAMAEDFDLWLRVSERAQVANINRPLIKYRMHDQSVSERNLVRQREVMKRAAEEAWARRGVAGAFAAEAPWRPGTDRASRYAFALKYGWLAWKHGFRETSRHYAGRSLKLGPLAWDSWRLTYCALGKPRPACEDAW